MLNAEECRTLAEQYRERANQESVPRVANVLRSVCHAYLALASQLELLASVERQEIARTARKDDPGP
ncbi:hypothetical protein [Bradyrhizobium guangdongense]|uniref:Uncharacterized protein n=1 Tax=Bradyrhizobium guangdongense TaxID=1325090 RepID=A0ABX6UDJ7_9BRAD|nr:hypothetical protein [Bradyrhizobium guangdongense]QAU38335.1 hypothetical protein X265_12095 [Bradyrhizobium guangdongense]QOZ59390.1 hypothetical protein XH86_12095 [Bradyrhizobium guangdongense]